MPRAVLTQTLRPERNAWRRFNFQPVHFTELITQTTATPPLIYKRPLIRECVAGGRQERRGYEHFHTRFLSASPPPFIDLDLFPLSPSAPPYHHLYSSPGSLFWMIGGHHALLMVSLLMEKVWQSWWFYLLPPCLHSNFLCGSSLTLSVSLSSTLFVYFSLYSSVFTQVKNITVQHDHKSVTSAHSPPLMWVSGTAINVLYAVITYQPAAGVLHGSHLCCVQGTSIMSRWKIPFIDM